MAKKAQKGPLAYPADGWSGRSKKPRNLRPGYLVALVFVLAFAVTTLLNYQRISDRISAFGYTPSTEMSAIKDSLKLTADGSLIFDSSRPVLDSQSDFNEHCNSHNADISVLGCYTNRQIYVYDVNVASLNGVKESTSAHELLHAVWARLGNAEQTRLAEYLNEVYLDSNYFELLEADLGNYKDSERLDELHSRIGTEIKDLPAELEKHYAKYFQDQDAIVAFYDSYIAPFKKLKSEITQLAKDLTSLKEQIETKTAEYESRASALNQTVAEFNSCASTVGCFANDAAFRSRRSALVAEQSAVSNLYAELDSLIKTYNQKVDAYNANILKSENLENMINSNAKVKENL